NAGNDGELAAAFEDLIRQKVAGLVVASDAYFVLRRELIVSLAARHAIPAIHFFREFAAVGGLMSYGNSLGEAYHKVGNYAGRILKGENPAELPVQQAEKIELVLNLKTAKKLGLTFPVALLGRADEVIE